LWCGKGFHTGHEIFIITITIHNYSTSSVLIIISWTHVFGYFWDVFGPDSAPCSKKSWAGLETDPSRCILALDVYCIWHAFASAFWILILYLSILWMDWFKGKSTGNHRFSH
jgi:hypothetical protein